MRALFNGAGGGVAAATGEREAAIVASDNSSWRLNRSILRPVGKPARALALSKGVSAWPDTGNATLRAGMRRTLTVFPNWPEREGGRTKQAAGAKPLSKGDHGGDNSKRSQKKLAEQLARRTTVRAPYSNPSSDRGVCGGRRVSI